MKVATLLDARGLAHRECVHLLNLCIQRAALRSLPSVPKENRTATFYSNGTSSLKFVCFFLKLSLQCFFLAKTSIFVNVFQYGVYSDEDHCTAILFHAFAISVTFALFSHLPCSPLPRSSVPRSSALWCTTTTRSCGAGPQPSTTTATTTMTLTSKHERRQTKKQTRN